MSPEERDRGPSAGRRPPIVPALEGLIALYERRPLVALGEAHWLREEADFIASLIRHPAFGSVVDAVVVEFGNAFRQPLIDRYTAGEDVADDELPRVWREAVGGLGSHVWESPIYERFFRLARAANQASPTGRRFRVLLGDPPLDPEKVRDGAGIRTLLEQRDTHFADLVEREILMPGRRALLLAGGAHFTWVSDLDPRGQPNVTARLEARFPGSTTVVLPYCVFDDLATARAEEVGRVDARLAGWPVPSLAQIAGTWLAGLDGTLLTGDRAMRIEPDGRETLVPITFYGRDGQPLERVVLGDLADALLYLGSAGSLTFVPPRRTQGSRRGAGQALGFHPAVRKGESWRSTCH